jgi:hypothetical protein
MYLPTNLSTSGGAYSGLNFYAGPYHHAIKTIPIRASIFQPLAGALSSSTLAASHDQDSTDDYAEISGSTCWNSAEEGRLIIMVASVEAPSQNNSNRYPASEDQKRLMPGCSMME